MAYLAKLAAVSTAWCALRTTLAIPQVQVSADLENLLALGLGGAAGWAWMALDEGRAAGPLGLGAGLACLLAGRCIDALEANIVAAKVAVARRGR